MARKPSHLGRTLRNSGKLADSPIVRMETRDLNEDEKARLATKEAERVARLERIAARARGEEV